MRDLDPADTNICDALQTEMQIAVRPGHAKERGNQRHQQHEVGVRGDGGGEPTQDWTRQRFGLRMLRRVPLQTVDDAVGPLLVDDAAVAQLSGPLDGSPPVGLGGLVQAPEKRR